MTWVDESADDQEVWTYMAGEGLFHARVSRVGDNLYRWITYDTPQQHGTAETLEDAKAQAEAAVQPKE